MPGRRHLLRFALALSVAFLGVVPSALAARSLTTGFFDGRPSPDAAEQGAWLDRMGEAGASVVRVHVNWASVAPGVRAPGFQPTNPADPGYRWGRVDAAIRGATARGLAVLISSSAAPRWGEGPQRPEDAAPGTWKPDVAEYGAFATALARRYSGSFPDPDPAAAGAPLPRVRFWQPWNEPNLSAHLTPQWSDGRPYSPEHYRGMQNAFYDAIKAVDPSNTVLTTGTAPYGDPFRGGSRISPRAFWRDALCIGRLGCAPLRFDVFAHHPYSVRGPRAHAFNADDITIPDLEKLVRLVRHAERGGHVLPRGPKRVWVTEISWDSSPPDPSGVPAKRFALWLEEALYLLWKQGADTILWFQIRDMAPDPSYDATYQSGIYLRDGRPKLAAQAFRFPFVTDRPKRGRAQLWARVPTPGEVIVQRRAKGRWVRLLRTRTFTPGQVFTRTVRVRKGTRLRAVAVGATSLIWTVR